MGLAATRDTKTAFVTLGRAGRVAFVNTTTRKITRYVQVGVDPSGVALNGGEETLYVVNRMSDGVSVVDVLSGRLIKSVPSAERPIRSRSIIDAMVATWTMPVRARSTTQNDFRPLL